MVELREGERLDTLPGTDLEIIQSRSVFSYGIDAVLLAHFPRVPLRGEIIDLCAGNGAVGLMLAARAAKTQSPETTPPVHLTQIEIQPYLSDMNQRSISHNQLDRQLSALTADIKEWAIQPQLSGNKIDLIVCNPPYFKMTNQSRTNASKPYTLARHEMTITFEDIARVSQQLLKSQGHLAVIHRPARFFEIVETLKAHHLIPKRIQFVYPKAGGSANLLLIDAIKDGSDGGEIFLSPLIVHKADDSYTDEIKKIYRG